VKSIVKNKSDLKQAKLKMNFDKMASLMAVVDKSNDNNVKAVLEESINYFSHMEAALDKKVVFEHLLKQMSDLALTDVQQKLSSTRSPDRVQAMSELVMPFQLPRLFKVQDDVGGMTETAHLCFDQVVMEAFMSKVGIMDWQAIAEALQSELRTRVLRGTSSSSGSNGAVA
jgi:hypothetical protein